MLLLWIFILAFGFAFTSFFRQYRDVDTLVLVAIGTAINANIYNAITMPLRAFGMTFGIDSILYTLFMFTIYLRAKDHSPAEARAMAVTTIEAILVSAVIEFFSRALHDGGISRAHWIVLSNYAVSSFVSLLCVRLMLCAMKAFYRLNKYALLFMCILGAVWLDAAFCCASAHFFFAKAAPLRGGLLPGSLVSRLVCAVASVCFYGLNETVWPADGKKRP